MARSGMTDLIQQLRAATNAGIDDATVAGETYWSDDHLQSELDRYQTYWRGAALTALPITTSGTVQYFDYLIPDGIGRYIEQNATGSGWAVKDSVGNTIGTALYSVNYDTRRVSFASTTGGSALYLDACSYALNRAAANVWRRKAGMAYQSIDWAGDNHDIKGSQEYAHCLEMAAFYESQGGVQVGWLTRTDENF